MSQRYRYAAIAIGLVVVTSHGRSREVMEPADVSEIESTRDGDAAPSDSESDTIQEDEGTADISTAIQSIEAAIRDLVPAVDESDRQVERQRNQRDLHAQEAMAFWALWMFVAAALTVLLTALGVCLIWKTLLSTRQAAIHTGEAATAAKDSVVEARAATRAAMGMNSLTEALERPLIGIRMPAEEFAFTGSGFEARHLMFHITNTGRSPARIIEVCRCWDGSADGRFPEPIDPRGPRKGTVKQYPRFVGGGSETEGIWSGHRQLGTFQIGPPERIFFHGFIRYRDLTGKPFVSGFCYFIDPAGDRRFGYAWPEQNIDQYHYNREDD